MLVRLLAAIAAVLALQCCGCSFSDLSFLNVQTSAPPRAISKEVQREFAACRSLEDVQRLLQVMENSREAQLWVEALLSGWGQHGNWYDVAVVEFLLKHWPSAYGDHPKFGPDSDRFDTRRLFDITQHVLSENPELVYQAFWYLQWERRPLDFATLMRDLEPPLMGQCVSIEGEFYPWFLMEAGIASGVSGECFGGSLASNLNYETLETDRLLINGYVASQRPFLKYDHKLGRYVVDTVAKDDNRYLTPDDQTASPRPTPLPNWSTDSN